FLLLFAAHPSPRDPLSFPTRRSSDLSPGRHARRAGLSEPGQHDPGARARLGGGVRGPQVAWHPHQKCRGPAWFAGKLYPPDGRRSEEHTSELQSRENLVCRLLLEKKK